MPSFRIPHSDSVGEKRKEFQARIEKDGVLDLFRKALTAFREKFMDDALPEDPMAFVREQLGVPKFDPKVIDELREELHDLQEELMTYDETFRRSFIMDQNMSFCLNVDTYGIFYMTPQKDDHSIFVPKVQSSLNRSYKVGSADTDSELGSPSCGDMKSKPKQGIYYSTPIKDNNDSSVRPKSGSPLQMQNTQSFSDSECAGINNSDSDSFKLMNAKPKLRVPGGPMVESKREECRKMMEKFGILQVLERALASLLMEPTFPEDSRAYLIENLQTHSLEFHEARALEREIELVRERLQEVMYKKDEDDNFSDI